MVPSGKLMLEDILFQLELIMSKPVGDPTMSEVDRELAPIFKQITTLSCGDIHHPAVSYVVNWLTQPHRTAEEFNYVLGPLSEYVYSTEGGGFDTNCFFTYRVYMYHMGIESLAVKCPILEGPWEYAAWLMVRIFKCCVDDQRHWPSYTVQDSITAWIISMIGDANLCPNLHLRWELMCLLKGTNINNHYGPNAIECVMLAMLDVDFNYLEEIPYTADLEMISFQDIVDIFQSFNNDDIFKYSHRLCNKLENVKTSRLSSIIYDVTCQYGMNTSKYNEPYELNTITNLLKTITGYVKVKLKERVGEGPERDFNCESRLDNILSVGHMFRIIMHNFQGCLLLPQLISFTSSLIMEVMEFICLTSRDLDEERQYEGQPYLEGIKHVNHDLGKLCVQHGYGNILHSPLGREIWRKYSNRLKRLRTSLMNIFAFSNVQALIYFDLLLKEV